MFLNNYREQGRPRGCRSGEQHRKARERERNQASKARRAGGGRGRPGSTLAQARHHPTPTTSRSYAEASSKTLGQQGAAGSSCIGRHSESRQTPPSPIPLRQGARERYPGCAGRRSHGSPTPSPGPGCTACPTVAAH